MGLSDNGTGRTGPRGCHFPLTPCTDQNSHFSTTAAKRSTDFRTADDPDALVISRVSVDTNREIVQVTSAPYGWTAKVTALLDRPI